MAALAGSIQCLYLLLSLSADPRPLADQDLFTSVAMTGTPHSPGSSAATGNRILLSQIASAVRDTLSDSSNPDEVANTQTAVRDLLNGRYQVEPEAISNFGSPLELSVSIANYDSILALLSLGADPNVFNDRPTLHIAVNIREPVLTALLLSYGADANLKSGPEQGFCMALHEADTTSFAAFIYPPRTEITSYVDFFEDDVKKVDTDSESAISARVKACIAILLHFGADIEAQDSNGDTPLVRRVLEGDFDIAEYLLSRGANLHAKDFAGHELSEKVNNLDSRRWLLHARKINTNSIVV
jgi:ankyrin repeat protein